jgi:hypothetical protein
MHYVILSPVDFPHPYAFYALRWISSLICIFFSLHFLRAGKGTWWIMVAAAFALPLLAEVLVCLRHGLPPLPYGQIIHQDTFPWNPITTPKSYGSFTIIPPLMAVALAWAWLEEKKKTSKA